MAHYFGPSPWQKIFSGIILAVLGLFLIAGLWGAVFSPLLSLPYDLARFGMNLFEQVTGQSQPSQPTQVNITILDLRETHPRSLSSEERQKYFAAVEVQLGQVIEQLATMAFYEVVSDEVMAVWLKKAFPLTLDKAAVAVFDSAALSAAARHQVYETYLKPLFSSDEEYGKATYAAYSLPYWAYYGLPESLQESLQKFQRNLMGEARDYFRNPASLWSFYQMRKAGVLRHFAQLPPDVRKAYIQHFAAVYTAIKLTSQSDFRAKYVEYLDAEKVWFEGYKTEEDSGLNTLHYKGMERAEADLSDATPDLYASLFAFRREAEGGKPLVNMWATVVDDFGNSLAKISE
ncbi:MAG: hypothetical protein A3F54_00145 [Candidatus Kerfeldbacteria bacterium RIFCSPHIGHO2_12_FULL_48_17]|uniref:Uncharacterized protein n=1 Tax=Candidatus Kerfeldbacteria bacterium RIFCSPHIGHO2_12_FULL_48_17 TaxID=1798542 RepID=A0A1G2B7V1_9BACT|nr:MAG: hypothetical protein A3F54_00145 [Candidatus Kerfeldbacteria bacterium RIFCSPHIGHO2_12_FULL_48_17]